MKMPEDKETIFKYQDKIHRRLESFINLSSLTYPSKLLYPILDINRNDIYEFLLLSRKLNLDKSVETIKRYNKKFLSSNEYAIVLSTLYNEFYDNLEKFKIKTKLKIIYKNKIRNFRVWKEGINKEFLNPLLEIKRYLDSELRRYIHSFYLHGSLSTNDYVEGWSDIDTLIILKRETVENPIALLEFRKKISQILPRLYLIDPSQHHGFFIVCEQELKFYPQHYFPLELFKYSTVFLEPSSNILFNIRDDQRERMEVFINFVNYFRDVYNNKKVLKSVFTWKLYLAKIMLLPTLYLQAKGKYCYKKNSFEIVKKEFINDWYSVEKATEIRKNWKNPNSLILYIQKNVAKLKNPYIPMMLLYIPKFKMINDDELENLKKEAFILSEKMLSRLKENAAKTNTL